LLPAAQVTCTQLPG